MLYNLNRFNDSLCKEYSVALLIQQPRYKINPTITKFEKNTLMGSVLLYKIHLSMRLRSVSWPLTLSLPKGRRQNFRLQIFKNVKSKLHHTENSKTRGK